MRTLRLARSAMSADRFGPAALVRLAVPEVRLRVARASGLPHAPVFDGETTDERGRADIARYIFLDPGAHDFFVD
jgi:hypothetical protein